MEALNGLVEDVAWIAVEDDSAPGRVRRVVMEQARRLDFSDHRVGEVGIAATELATNLDRHAVRGSVLVRIRRAAGEGAVELILSDGGPGFADLAQLTPDGRSTAGTLGIGLGAAMRLATWFEAHSVPGRGTVMMATFWSAGAPSARPSYAALTRPMNGETVCGDACAVWSARCGNVALLLADGLGHGELAAMASREAVRTFAAREPDERPARTLQRLNGALRSTRGAAAAVIGYDADAAMLTFAGVGNIAAWIDDGERRHGLLSTPGIVGAYTKPVRELEMSVKPDSLVVMHSDGLTSKWDVNAYPGLRVRDPHLLAATLMRDAGLRHDDASVIVARAS